jgi:hypothetical protein
MCGCGKNRAPLFNILRGMNKVSHNFQNMRKQAANQQAQRVGPVARPAAVARPNGLRGAVPDALRVARQRAVVAAVRRRR